MERNKVQSHLEPQPRRSKPESETLSAMDIASLVLEFRLSVSHLLGTTDPQRTKYEFRSRDSWLNSFEYSLFDELSQQRFALRHQRAVLPLESQTGKCRDLQSPVGSKRRARFSQMVRE
jgi:hypothetical protein